MPPCAADQLTTVPSPSGERGQDATVPRDQLCEWTIAVLARVGKPPLRFKGRMITRRELDFGHPTSPTPLRIELWEKAKTGFVLSFSQIEKGQIALSSHSFLTLPEARDFLERRCQDLTVADLKAVDVDSLLHHLQLLLCFRQRFGLLVSDVLAQWPFSPDIQEHD